jgi:general secretion pathway protein D
MKRRSAGGDKRRHEASIRRCCARFALLFQLLIVLSGMTAASYAQAPDLTPATSTPRENPDSQSADSTVPADAPAVESDDLSVALERPGDLNLHGLSLNEALFTISEQWNINVVAGDVEGTVNGVFKQAPLREILDSILLSNGYNYRAVGKSLVVSSVSELGQINPFFQSATIPVRSADIDEVVEGAKLLSTPQGQVRALKSAHSIVVLDFPDRIKMIREFVAAIDSASSGRFASPDGRTGVPLEVGYFRTQHISARTAELVIQTILSKDGRVGVMEKEDRLLVTDYAENLAVVERVLQQIDHPRPQVRITALIYDISLQDIEKLGINWGNQAGSSVEIDSSGERTRDVALDVDSIMQVPFQAGTTGSTLTFMNLSRHIDITAVVLALQQASDARLLANPNVLALENEEAIFERVSEIPYQQLTETQQGGQIGTTAFKKAGITLRVRPKIAAEGLIQMEVSPEISRLTGFTPGDNQPIIDISSTSTVLNIANRQTVVIGGLRQRSDVGDFTGVPFLKDIKLVGRLFRARDTDVRESELVVFISPEIVSYADDPTLRQQMAADTVRCRLDQIPEAEGCPPCCRRLPPGQCVEAPRYETVPPEEQQMVPVEQSEATIERLPPPQPYELPPMSADEIPSAEYQFGVAGRSHLVRTLVDEHRLRRLPKVEATSLTIPPAIAVNTLFGGPPTPHANTAASPAVDVRR